MQSANDNSFEDCSGGDEKVRHGSTNVLDATALTTASVAVLEKNWDLQMSASDDEGDVNQNANDQAGELPQDENDAERDEDASASLLTLQDYLLQDMQPMDDHQLHLRDFNNAASEDPQVDEEEEEDKEEEAAEAADQEPDRKERLYHGSEEEQSDTDADSDEEDEEEEDETLDSPPISGLAELSLQRERSAMDAYSQLMFASNVNTSANEKPAGAAGVTLASLEAVDVLKFYEILD